MSDDAINIKNFNCASSGTVCKMSTGMVFSTLRETIVKKSLKYTVEKVLQDQYDVGFNKIRDNYPQLYFAHFEKVLHIDDEDIKWLDRGADEKWSIHRLYQEMIEVGTHPREKYIPIEVYKGTQEIAIWQKASSYLKKMVPEDFEKFKEKEKQLLIKKINHCIAETQNLSPRAVIKKIFLTEKGMTKAKSLMSINVIDNNYKSK